MATTQDGNKLVIAYGSLTITCVEDGVSSYFHVKYSDDGEGFTSSNGETLGKWMGTCVDNNPNDPTDFNAYDWRKIVGEDGTNGIDGADGSNGVSTYFYVKFSANADGSGMTEVPQDDTKYMGVCSTTSSTAPTQYREYKWTQCRGNDGASGTPGVSMMSIVPQYYASANSDEYSNNDADWKDSPFDWGEDRPYIFIRYKTLYDDGTCKYSTPQLDETFTTLGDWCLSEDITKIDGGKIATGTIHASAIQANTLTADMITTGELVSKNKKLRINLDYGTFTCEAVDAKISTTVSNQFTQANIIAAINGNTSSAWIIADQISLTGYTSVNDKFKIDLDGSMEATGGKIGGWSIDDDGMYCRNIVGNTIYRTSISSNNYPFSTTYIDSANNTLYSMYITSSGIINCNSIISNGESSFGDKLYPVRIGKQYINMNNGNINNVCSINSNMQTSCTIYLNNDTTYIYDNNYMPQIGPMQSFLAHIYCNNIYSGNLIRGNEVLCNSIECTDTITCKNLTVSQNIVSPQSLASIKKNFEKFDGGLSIIDEIDLYKYNLKTESDDEKKHIGFVIGDGFNYSSEITSLDGNGDEAGVDLYSMASLNLQCIKELKAIVEEQQKQIEELKKEVGNKNGTSNDFRN